jgi:Fic family protein
MNNLNGFGARKQIVRKSNFGHCLTPAAPFAGRLVAMSDELKALFERLRNYQMSPEEIQEQRISFAYGNTNYENKEITRDDVVRSSYSLGVRHGQEETPGS